MKQIMSKFIVSLGALGMMFSATSTVSPVPESTGTSFSRTSKYLKLVKAEKQSNEALTTFIANEQKGCEAKGMNLQLSGQGVLACVVIPPQPVATPAPPAASKK